MIGQPRNDALHTHKRHMHFRHGGCHADITLIGNGGNVTGLGTGQITAGNAHIGFQKLCT